EIVKSDALEEAAEFSETLGCPVYQQPSNCGAHFLSERPCYMGALPRNQPQVRDLLSRYDLMIALGANPLQMSVYHEVEPLPEGMAIVQIGLNDWHIGKNFAVEIAIKADVRQTLKALIPVLRRFGGVGLEKRAKSGIAALAYDNWRARRERLVA